MLKGYAHSVPLLTPLFKTMTSRKKKLTRAFAGGAPGLATTTRARPQSWPGGYRRDRPTPAIKTTSKSLHSDLTPQDEKESETRIYQSESKMKPGLMLGFILCLTGSTWFLIPFVPAGADDYSGLSLIILTVRTE